jgi:hypothetical protein
MYAARLYSSRPLQLRSFHSSLGCHGKPLIPLFSVRYVLRQSGTVAMVTGCCLCTASNGIRVIRLQAGRSGVRISAMYKRFLSPPIRPGRLWVAFSLLLNWYWLCFPGIKRPEREVNYIRVVLRSKMKGAVPPLSLYSLWRGQGKLYLLVGISSKTLLCLIKYCWMKFLLISFQVGDGRCRWNLSHCYPRRRLGFVIRRGSIISPR